MKITIVDNINCHHVCGTNGMFQKIEKKKFTTTVDSHYLDLAYLNNRLSQSENLVPA